MKYFPYIIAIAGLLFAFNVVFAVGVAYGRDMQQELSEDRAMELPDPYETDCYDWQEIEYVIFGEIQE